MKRSNLLSIICCAVLFSFAPLAVHAAPPMDPNAMRNLMRQQHGSMNKVIVRHDASLAACGGYTNQINAINSTYAACLNPDTAPAGSPVSNFNKMSNIQLGSFCGQLPLNQCVQNVLNQQHAFCDAKVLPMKQQAERLKAQCSQAKKECTDAKAKKQQLDQASAALATKRSQLEAQLTQVVREQAANHAALVRANQEVTHQCTIQVPAHPVPPPVHILLPNIQ